MTDIEMAAITEALTCFRTTRGLRRSGLFLMLRDELKDRDKARATEAEGPPSPLYSRHFAGLWVEDREDDHEPEERYIEPGPHAPELVQDVMVPRDCTFASIVEFVNHPQVSFDELQAALLGIIERPPTWTELMSILDAHYPADIFDGSSGDMGPRLVRLIRVIDEQAAEIGRLREALTPSAETKCVYWGEFNFSHEATSEDGDSYTETHAVPWTVIKGIMAAILKRADVEPVAATKEREEPRQLPPCERWAVVSPGGGLRYVGTALVDRGHTECRGYIRDCGRGYRVVRVAITEVESQ